MGGRLLHLLVVFADTVVRPNAVAMRRSRRQRLWLGGRGNSERGVRGGLLIYGSEPRGAGAGLVVSWGKAAGDGLTGPFAGSSVCTLSSDVPALA